MSNSASALSIGQSVRVHSNYGQCLIGTVTGIGRVNVTVASFGKQPVSRIHTDPCSRCADHSVTCYECASAEVYLMTTITQRPIVRRPPTHCGSPMTALNPADQRITERSWYCPTCNVINTYAVR